MSEKNFTKQDLSGYLPVVSLVIFIISALVFASYTLFLLLFHDYIWGFFLGLFFCPITILGMILGLVSFFNKQKRKLNIVLSILNFILFILFGGLFILAVLDAYGYYPREPLRKEIIVSIPSDASEFSSSEINTIVKILEKRLKALCIRYKVVPLEKNQISIRISDPSKAYLGIGHEPDKAEVSKRSQKLLEKDAGFDTTNFKKLYRKYISEYNLKSIINILTKRGKLEFRLVHKDNDLLVQQYKADPKMIPLGYEPLEMIERTPDNKTERRICFVKIKPEMSDKSVKSAFPSRDQYGQIFISLEFNSEGTKQFEKVTRENVGRQLAIVLDGTLYSAPVIKQAIEGGRAQITGNFSGDEAEEISTALISGTLPVELNVEQINELDDNGNLVVDISQR